MITFILWCLPINQAVTPHLGGNVECREDTAHMELNRATLRENKISLEIQGKQSYISTKQFTIQISLQCKLVRDYQR